MDTAAFPAELVAVEVPGVSSSGGEDSLELPVEEAEDGRVSVELNMSGAMEEGERLSGLGSNIGLSGECRVKCIQQA